MMRSIVITGSKGGIGYHLAAAFLKRDCEGSLTFAPGTCIMLEFIASFFNKRDLFA